jgi:alkylated DNA repair dioxygenase AlkB
MFTDIERLTMINNFAPAATGMSRDEIIFHLQRGESLHVRSLTGEWLRSYYWSEDRPVRCDWNEPANRVCAIDDIPETGEQLIDGERVIVCFYQLGDQPIWRQDNAAAA